jgi:hypothetical protein
MGIVFYETEYASSLLEIGTDKISQRDLNFLAKFWKQEGLTQHETQLKLAEFCLDNDPYFNLIINRIRLKRAINHAENFLLRKPGDILIHQMELDIISKINNYKYEKIIFCMLVCAKYYREYPSRKTVRYSRYTQGIYNNQKIKDIIDISATAMTKKEWRIAKHELTKIGILTPTIIDPNRFALGFNQIPNMPAIIISDYRNIVGYYQIYKGDNMIYCIECNVITSKRGNNHRMCDSCSKEKRRILVNENVRNHYVLHKS